MAWGSQVFDFEFDLMPGKEGEQSFSIWTPGVLNVTAAGDRVFYMGVYTPEQVQRARQQSPFRFPFVLLTARITHFQRFTLRNPGEYVLVVRMSSWAGVGGPFHVRCTGELAQS